MNNNNNSKNNSKNKKNNNNHLLQQLLILMKITMSVAFYHPIHNFYVNILQEIHQTSLQIMIMMIIKNSIWTKNILNKKIQTKIFFIIIY